MTLHELRAIQRFVHQEYTEELRLGQLPERDKVIAVVALEREIKLKTMDPRKRD